MEVRNDHSPLARAFIETDRVAQAQDTVLVPYELNDQLSGPRDALVSDDWADPADEAAKNHRLPSLRIP